MLVVVVVLLLSQTHQVVGDEHHPLFELPKLVYRIHQFRREVERKQEEALKQLEETLQIEEKENPQFVLSVAGDVTLGYYDGQSQWNRFDQVYNKQGYAYFMERVKPIFEADDLTLVNLEGPLTTGGIKQDKKFAIKGEPEYAKILSEGSIEVVNLANNHTYDYGAEGFRQTQKALEEENIGYFGERILYFTEVNDIKVAFIGAKGWSSGSWVKSALKESIKEAKEKADVVIMMFHWGDEGKYTINKVQQDLGYFVIDEGVNLVVGSHPHNVQGIEIYKDVPIVYSLGNFSFGANRNPSDQATFIYQQTFELTDEGIQLKEGKVIPCYISSEKTLNNYQPLPLEGEEKEKVMKRLIQYSSDFQQSFFD